MLASNHRLVRKVPSMLGQGVFTAPEVGRLVGAPANRIRRWFDGREPVFRGERFDGRLTLSFQDLITALLIEAFRRHGVSLQTVRKAGAQLAKDLACPRPFAMRSVATDGKRVFVWMAQEEGDEKLLDVVSSQRVFAEVFAPLLRQTDYSKQAIAERWWPMGKDSPVVVDPRIAFGAPTVRGVRTNALHGPVRAGDSPATVASWYAVPEADVLAAVEFEERLSRKAA